MGISLTGLTPATTYDALIKVGDNGPLTGALKVLSDGLGTNLPMEASTTAINFTGVLTQAGTTLQPTLVSGTNIKTINSTSLLGSGNIAVVTSPSGVAGAIQFSNGSAFASDAANLFWDDTNKRLGIGTGNLSPQSKLQVMNDVIVGRRGFDGNEQNGTLRVVSASTFGSLGFSSKYDLFASGLRSYAIDPIYERDLRFFTKNQDANANDGTEKMRILGNGNVGINETTPTARLQVKGSGSTSATTSLLVQNSAGTAALTVKDDLSVALASGGQLNVPNGGILSQGGVKANDSSWGVGWNNSFTWGIRGDSGRIGFGSGTSGAGALDTAISRSAAGVLEVNNGTMGTLAAINVASYKVNGTSGFTGTGIYTTFTIVGGIITNAS